MSKMVTFRLNKIVRDKLPDTMRAEGQQIEVAQLEGREKTQALINNLVEEARELDPGLPTYGEELADVAQAIQDLVTDSGIDVESIRREKFVKKGRFSKGMFVTKITLLATDKWVGYYRKEPLKYVEERDY